MFCREKGELGNVDDAALAHISLLPFKHVLPNGRYFVEDFAQIVSVRDQNTDSKP